MDFYGLLVIINRFWGVLLILVLIGVGVLLIKTLNIFKFAFF